MIDRKQNWRSATSKPTVLMFFIVMLACGATTPVRSQSSDNKDGNYGYGHFGRGR